MPQTLEIPQRFGPEGPPPDDLLAYLRARPAGPQVQYRPSPQVSRMFAGPTEAEQIAAYDKPVESPIMEDPFVNLALAGVGGEGAPGFFARLLNNVGWNLAMAANKPPKMERPFADPRTDQSLEHQLTYQGTPIPETYADVKPGILRSSEVLPAGARPNWYTGEHFRQAEAYSPYRARQTEKGIGDLITFGGHAGQRGATENLDIRELANPRWIREDPGASLLTPQVKGQFGRLGPEGPEGLIWHGINLYGNPETASIRLGMLQREGVNRGWFNRTPTSHFGPFFIGAKPEDLPKSAVVPRNFREDPAAQIRPEWDKYDIGKTVSGRPVPPVTIHPSKFKVMDTTGTGYGVLSPTRQGREFGQDRPMQRKGGNFAVRTMEGDLMPAGAENYQIALQNARIRAAMQSSKTSRPEFNRLWNILRENEAALKSPMAPLKNWPTQPLEDIGKLFEEVPK